MTQAVRSVQNTSSEDLKRVLFITYYFPPSGGPGVQRALKYVKYLPSFGWQPLVLTVDESYASYPSLDPDLKDEVPEATEVVRTKAWDPYSLYARMLGKPKEQAVGVGFIDESGDNTRQALGKWLRGNLFIPDARVGWVPFARRAANRLIREQPVDAIITTGPPHSTHLIGHKIAKRHGIPWLADFRDPWTGIDFYESLKMTSFSKKRDARMESRVLAGADAVVAVTPGMKESLSSKSGRSVDLIMNGFDPIDFESIDSDSIDSDSNDSDSNDVHPQEFALAYVGNMNDARNPVGLWKALSICKTELGPFRVRLVGPIDKTVARSIREFGLDDIVTIESPVSHSAAVRIMSRSAVLLLVINNVAGSHGIMTGKLFEYIGSGRPVLGIGPPDGDAAAALVRSGAGVMFDWNDVDGIVEYLRFNIDASGGAVRLEGASEQGKQEFSRLKQAGQLAGKLDEISQV